MYALAVGGGCSGRRCGCHAATHDLVIVILGVIAAADLLALTHRTSRRCLPRDGVLGCSGGTMLPRPAGVNECLGLRPRGESEGAGVRSACRTSPGRIQVAEPHEYSAKPSTPGGRVPGVDEVPEGCKFHVRARSGATGPMPPRPETSPSAATYARRSSTPSRASMRTGPRFSAEPRPRVAAIMSHGPGPHAATETGPVASASIAAFDGAATENFRTARCHNHERRMANRFEHDGAFGEVKSRSRRCQGHFAGIYGLGCL